MYLDNIEVREGPFYTKKVSIIKTVDENMNELTEDLIGEQTGNLEILRLTGEIQGLLLELTL